MHISSLLALMVGASALLTATCAIRDNPFDPLSPLHQPPNISVRFSFDDPSRLISNTDTAYTAIAPITVSFDVQSTDIFNPNRNLPTSVNYLSGTNAQAPKGFNYLSKKISFSDSGLHTLIFSSSADNGAKTEKTYRFLIKQPERPYINSIECTPDIFPLKSDESMDIKIEIIDDDLTADSIFFDITKMNRTGHVLHERARKYTVVERTNVNSDTEYTQKVTVYIFDKFGKKDSITTNIRFSKDKKITRGVPPTLENIFILEPYPVIYSGQILQFGIWALDVDGTIVSYEWNFGDNLLSTEINPFHAYSKPGTYFLTATVTDDSGSTASKSMSITVQPKRLIKPYFTKFEVVNDSGPAPLTFSVSVTAQDIDGKVASLSFSYYDEIPQFLPIWTTVNNKEFTINTPGIHYLHVIAIDNDYNQADTVHTIIVTSPRF